MNVYSKILMASVPALILADDNDRVGANRCSNGSLTTVTGRSWLDRSGNRITGARFEIRRSQLDGPTVNLNPSSDENMIKMIYDGTSFDFRLPANSSVYQRISNDWVIEFQNPPPGFSSWPEEFELEIYRSIVNPCFSDHVKVSFALPPPPPPPEYSKIVRPELGSVTWVDSTDAAEPIKIEFNRDIALNAGAMAIYYVEDGLPTSFQLQSEWIDGSILTIPAPNNQWPMGLGNLVLSSSFIPRLETNGDLRFAVGFTRVDDYSVDSDNDAITLIFNQDVTAGENLQVKYNEEDEWKPLEIEWEQGTSSDSLTIGAPEGGWPSEEIQLRLHVNSVEPRLFDMENHEDHADYYFVDVMGLSPQEPPIDPEPPVDPEPPSGDHAKIEYPKQTDGQVIGIRDSIEIVFDRPVDISGNCCEQLQVIHYLLDDNFQKVKNLGPLYLPPSTGEQVIQIQAPDDENNTNGTWLAGTGVEIGNGVNIEVTFDSRVVTPNFEGDSDSAFFRVEPEN